ncbi:MAG: Rieske 2Fe-2S domain-containing protein [Firmicutes bacterium]|nr:Rieske 2Fe-2S domain-containing protein [Bacillota bacterium]
MGYVKVAETKDLLEGGKLKISVEGRDILVSNINGEYFGIDNRCNHMGGSLYDGIMEGDRVSCPKHGTVFNLKTGEVEDRGKLFFIKVKVGNQRSYPVKIEGGDILVDIK